MGDKYLNMYYETYIELLQEKTDWQTHARNANSYIKRILEHLLKIKYNRDIYCKNHWALEIENFREEASKSLRWNTKRQNTNAVNDVLNKIQVSYENAKNIYENDRIEDRTLPYISHILPDECPYTLKELLEFDDLEKLLDKLPELEDFK